MSRFADLIGQELAATVLQKAVREGRLTHAYLFAGPEGTGKMTTALALAAALNCENPTESGDSCGDCVQCRMIHGDGHPDVQIISPGGAQTKIEQMRDVRRGASFAPIRGKYKVVIVEQADTLNDAAANSILKTLEEPPDYLVIILLSRNPGLLLPTIRSRCLIVRFSGVPADELTSALIERFGAGETEARFLAAYSEGRPGIAISLLGNEGFFEWRTRVVELAVRVASTDVRHALKLSEELQGLSQADKETGKTQRAAMRQTLDALVLWYRDLLSLSIQGGSAQIVNSDLRGSLSSVHITPDRITAAIDTLLWARKCVEGNANVQMMADVTMMRLMK